MIALALAIGLALVGLALLFSLLRLWRGPTLPDRILALDTLSLNAIALIVLFSLWVGNALYLVAALLLAVLGFISTVALSQFSLRQRVIEPSDHESPPTSVPRHD
ncbi:K+/H+ antiporter subunit F [Halothiobacillus sp. DCM-1]|uniref:K+/H+ antiporter subunit F n=1 Tax=Halothiobacillus sp. DCM-1 TaxID=3112558 RepID=UPI00324516FE